ncbi:hypothetical protein KAH81_07990 [bacterium]|nr:hypothetical protein [bacterium]
MALEKCKTVDEWLQIGNLIVQADDQTIGTVTGDCQRGYCGSNVGRHRPTAGAIFSSDIM